MGNKKEKKYDYIDFSDVPEDAKSCANCGGRMRCTNPSSPCYGEFCGIYPGTGPIRVKNIDK